MHRRVSNISRIIEDDGIGIIQYFNVEGLNEIIVKEPQVLFDKVTELIVETFSKESLDTKEEKGIFSLSVFDSATKEVDNIARINF